LRKQRQTVDTRAGEREDLSGVGRREREREREEREGEKEKEERGKAKRGAGRTSSRG